MLDTTQGLEGVDMRMSIILSVLTIVCLTATETQAQPHPIIGTWEMNAERSTFVPGRELRTEVRRFEEREDGFILFTLALIDADGDPGFTQAAFKLDGRGYPIFTQGSLAQFLMTGSESGRRVWLATDPNTLENRLENGQPGLVFTHSVSPDGRTMVGTMTGTNAQGQTFTERLVFERVD